MTDAMTPEEVLCAAADVIEERGWCQNQYVDIRGRVCTYGAIYVAVTGSPTIGDPQRLHLPLLNKTRHLLFEKLGTPIAEWNDKKDQTKENVVATLRQGC